MLSEAFIDGSVMFFIVLAIGLAVLLTEKHEKGEYDWKEFAKWVFLGLVLGLAAFLGFLVRGGD